VKKSPLKLGRVFRGVGSFGPMRLVELAPDFVVFRILSTRDKVRLDRSEFLGMLAA